MKIKSHHLYAFFLFLWSVSNCIAGPGGGPPPPQATPPPPGLPIDTGIVLLVCAAILLGIYKIYVTKLHKKRQLKN